jgi:hypothetical protein
MREISSYKVLVRELREEDHFEHLVIDGHNIKMDHNGMEWENVHLIYLAEKFDWWHPLVNFVIDLWVLQSSGNILNG